MVINMNQKFKTKEDMHEMERDHRDIPIPYYYTGYNKALDDVFESFAERVEFYKKYRYSPADFMDEQSEDYKEWQKYYTKEVKPNNLKPISFWFEVWLFDYCFKDIGEM